MLCSLIFSCGNDSTETDPNAGKYLKGFIGTWKYEGNQLPPYGRTDVSTPSKLTIYENGTFTFKGESMFLERDDKLNIKIIDDKGTWTFDDTKGVLQMVKNVVKSDGTSHPDYFYYTIVYPTNEMILFVKDSERRLFFTKE